MGPEQPAESKLSQGGFAQIFVRTILGQTITVAIDGTLTTDDLLTKIRGKMDLSGHGLMFASRRIEAGRLLTDYNIKKYSIFQQSCRLLGGMEAIDLIAEPEPEMESAVAHVRVSNHLDVLVLVPVFTYTCSSCIFVCSNSATYRPSTITGYAD